LPGVDPNAARITISLNNIPLIEALKYITELAGLKFKVEPYAVYIVPQGTPTEVLLTKEYKVPPGFISTSPSTAAPTRSLRPHRLMPRRVARRSRRDAMQKSFSPRAACRFRPAPLRRISRQAAVWWCATPRRTLI
jgi:general secretion pathway protein D